MMLPICVPSIFSKYTRLPAGSTIATAISQPFLRASAAAGAAAFFAFSSVTGSPYAAGPCANAIDATALTTIVPISEYCMRTLLPSLGARELVHLDRCKQRHRSAPIVEPGRRWPIEVVLLRRSGTGACAHIDYRSILVYVRQQRAP